MDITRSINETQSPLILRIKRPITDVPIERLNTVLSKRRKCMDTCVLSEANFQYVGTDTELNADLSQNSFDNLENMDAFGIRKIVWKSSSAAKMLDTNSTKNKKFSVNLSGRKREYLGENDFEKVSNESEDSQKQPEPKRSLRIIDLLEESPVVDPLAVTMNGMKLISSPVCSSVEVKSPFDLNKCSNEFVYDIYRMTEVTDLDSKLWNKMSFDVDEFDAVETEKFLENRYFEDDDSDSNSESNWRNDYPDEEDEERSENYSSNRSSRSSSESGSEYADFGFSNRYDIYDL